MKYQEQQFLSFVDSLARKTGETAFCEAVKKGYKVICESERADRYQHDRQLNQNDIQNDEYSVSNKIVDMLIDEFTKAGWEVDTDEDGFDIPFIKESDSYPHPSSYKKCVGGRVVLLGYTLKNDRFITPLAISSDGNSIYVYSLMAYEDDDSYRPTVIWSVEGYLKTNEIQSVNNLITHIQKIANRMRTPPNGIVYSGAVDCNYYIDIWEGIQQNHYDALIPFDEYMSLNSK